MNCNKCLQELTINNVENNELQGKFDFLITNILSYNNDNKMIEDFVNKYILHLNELKGEDILKSETIEIIKLSNGEINNFDEITDCMEITLLEQLLNISKNLLDNIFIIIGNEYVYITNIENGRKVIENNFIEIVNNNFTYLDVVYDIQDIVIKNININNKIVVKFVINQAESEKETYQIDNIVTMNETLKNIAMLDEKTDTEPEQLEIVAKCINNISENNPEFAEDLDDGIRVWLSDFNIEMPITKVSRIDRLKKLRNENPENIPKITTLKQEQINSFLNEDSDIRNMCKPETIFLQNNGQICQGKDNTPINIQNPKLKNIVLKDMCKGYNNYQYNPKKNVINCINNSLGGKKSKKNNKKYKEKKIKTRKRKITKRKITKGKNTKRK